MIWIDYVIFALSFLAVLAIGVYFPRKNESREDDCVGGRRIWPTRIVLRNDHNESVSPVPGK